MHKIFSKNIKKIALIFAINFIIFSINNISASELKVGFHQSPQDNSNTTAMNLEYVSGIDILYGNINIGVNMDLDHDIHLAYGGLLWQFNLMGGYIDFGVGVAVHDNKLKFKNLKPNTIINSQLLIREVAEIGISFFVNQKLGLYVSHLSNSDFSHFSDGVTNIGIRYGFKF